MVGAVVEMAARAVDQVFPGWALRVDLERFTLRCMDCCVLGQAAGIEHPVGFYAARQAARQYDDALTRVTALLPEGERRQWELFVFASDEMYGAQWRELITERQALAHFMAEEAAKVAEERGVTI